MLTPECERLIAAEYSSGQTLKQVAAKWGLSRFLTTAAVRSAGGVIRPRQVSNRASIMALVAKRRRFSDAEESEIVRRYLSGESMGDLAKALGVNVSTIHLAVKRQGAQARPANGRMFTDSEEQVIAARYAGGESAPTIAKSLGVWSATIQNAIVRAGASLREHTRTHRINDSAFLNAQDGEAAAYFVGLLMSDGCVTEERVAISLAGDDGQHLESFRDFLESEHPIRGLPSISRVIAGRPFTCKAARVLSIHSPTLVTSLLRYGVTPRKSHTAAVCGGLEHNRHFWRGEVCGDGWVNAERRTGRTGKRTGEVYSRPNIGLCSASRVLMEQFADFVQSSTSVRPRIRKNRIWRVEFVGHNAVDVTRLLFDGCTVALPRKWESAKAILKWMPRKQRDNTVIQTV